MYFCKSEPSLRKKHERRIAVDRDRFFSLITHFRAILGLRGRYISQYSTSISDVPLQQHFYRTAIITILISHCALRICALCIELRITHCALRIELRIVHCALNYALRIVHYALNYALCIVH